MIYFNSLSQDKLSVGQAKQFALLTIHVTCSSTILNTTSYWPINYESNSAFCNCVVAKIIWQI